MQIHLRTILLLIAVSTGCQTASQPQASQTAAIKLRIDPKKFSFIHPATGDIFALHLGDALNNDTGGITEVPKNIKIGMRDATSSYYEPRDKDDCGYSCAESLWTRDTADRVARNTGIQYQADTGRLLITEDSSDASPCRRYILYSRHSGGGYTVTYLAPKPTEVPEDVQLEFRSLPSDVHLLPGDRAEIDGDIMLIDDVPQSPHPFSIGG